MATVCTQFITHVINLLIHMICHTCMAYTTIASCSCDAPQMALWSVAAVSLHIPDSIQMAAPMPWDKTEHTFSHDFRAIELESYIFIVYEIIGIVCRL